MNSPAAPDGSPLPDGDSAHLVAQALARELTALPRGARAPSEAELVARFAIPRSRARQVVDLLEEGMLVERRHGAGTFVTRPYEYVVSAAPASLHQTLQAAGGTVRTLPLAVRPIAAPAWIAALLDVPAGEPVPEVTRVGYLDGAPAVHLREVFAPGVLAEPKIAVHAIESLEEILRATGATPYRAACRGTAETAPEEVGERLGLPPARLVWRVDSLIRDRVTGRPLVVSHNHSRMDLIRMIFDLGGLPEAGQTPAERCVNSSDVWGETCGDVHREAPPPTAAAHGQNQG